MLTNDDIKKMMDVFATKQDLKNLREEMATKDELREVTTAVDNVFGEVKAMREDQAMHFQSHEDNRVEHIEIKSRLKRIEAVTADLGVR